MRQACSTTLCATDTPSPRMVGRPLLWTWTVALSCTLTRAPIRMKQTSPRTTALNHTLDAGPTCTSPTICALCWTYALGSICGVLPLWVTITGAARSRRRAYFFLSRVSRTFSRSSGVVDNVSNTLATA